jgi:hypothetical protein
METTTRRRPLRLTLAGLLTIAALTVPAVAAARTSSVEPASAPAISGPAIAAPALPGTATSVTPAAVAPLPELPATWPSSHLEVGLMDDPGGAAALHASGAYKFRYEYLCGGVNTGTGWSTWNAGAKYADYFADDSFAHGMTPVYIYYQLLQSKPAGGAENVADLNNLKNVSTMKAYWADVRLLFQHLGAYSKTMVVDIEPDLWGYIQQASSGDAGSSVPAAVASTNDADVAGLPNNADGFAQAFVKLRDKYAPKILLGYELSMWGTLTDPLSQNIPLNQIDALAARSTAFQKSLGASFDLVFTDPADRDAGYDQYVNGDGGNSWWDATDYARFDQYVGDFVRGTGRRMVLWQIPLGNTKMRAMNNSWGHYQDNHVEWWFDDATGTHLSTTLNAGVIAMLFGGGADGTTSVFDTMGDGVTNPAPINGNTTASYSSDDDGGYFRHQVNAYYGAGPTPLPGTAYATSAAVGSSVVMRGTSQSINAYVTAAASGNALVDVQLFGPADTQVAHWSHDNVALTAGNRQTLTDAWSAGASAATGGYKIKIAIEPVGGGDLLDWNDGAAGFKVVAAGTYVAVDPTRLVDTRIGLGSNGNALVAHKPRSLYVGGATVGGKVPVPANAIAVTGNVTVTGQSSAGYVTVGPAVAATPDFSTLNFPMHDNRANGVTVALASNGTLAAVFVGASSTSKTDLLFDVTGYFLPDFAHAAYFQVPPYRALDTREGKSLGAFYTAKPQKFSVGSGVPSEAVAVTGNLTVTGQTAAGYVALGPTVTSKPSFSTINFPTRDTRANNVTVQLGAGGTLQAVLVSAAGARTQLVFDVTGYYRVTSGGAAYVPITPVRTVDTRIGLGSGKALAHGVMTTLPLAGYLPAGTVAVSANITATGQTTAGLIAVAPSLTWPAKISTLNFPVRDNRANGLVVPVDGKRAVCAVFSGVSSPSSTHLIFDLTGYFLPVP